jgi:hypothetical protein
MIQGAVKEQDEVILMPLGPIPLSTLASMLRVNYNSRAHSKLLGRHRKAEG